MSKIIFLGTCSGTEPMVGMHHTSWILDSGEGIYWFDGGESCAFTAHTNGIDVLDTVALFVSHPHIDHVGGIANLFACMSKLIARSTRKLRENNKLKVFFPDHDIFEAIVAIFRSGARRKCNFDLEEYAVHDGALYKDDRIAVSAIHNRHLKEDGSNGWHSYSFFIENSGKKIETLF